MAPQKDYVGKNTHNKTRRYKRSSSDSDKDDKTEVAENNFSFEFNEFERQYHRQRDIKNKTNNKKAWFRVCFATLIAIGFSCFFTGVPEWILVLLALAAITCLLEMRRLPKTSPTSIPIPSPRPIPSRNHDVDRDVFTIKNAIAYYALILITVASTSGKHTVFGDALVSFFAVIFCLLIGVIALIPVLFFTDIFKLKSLSLKAKSNSDILIPVLGYLFLLVTSHHELFFG